MKSAEEMANELFERRETYLTEKRKKMRNMRHAARIAACFLAAVSVIGLSAATYTGFISEKPQEGRNIGTPVGDTAREKTDFTENGDTLQPAEQKVPASQEITQSAEQKTPAPQEKQAEKTQQEETAEESKEETYSQETLAVDRPATSNPGDTGALKAYEAVWGGSYYVAQTGKWVVLLTEDTPENRAAVFMLNPDLPQSDIIFQQAEYSEAYLIKLMTDISGAMGREELPFVSTAALREDLNCVQVTVTTEDKDALAKLSAYDEQGGAIQIIQGSGRSVNEPMEQKGPLIEQKGAMQE